MNSSPLPEPLEISPLDELFARTLGRVAGAKPMVQEAAKQVSAARQAGHTCLPLTELGGDLATWVSALRDSPAVGLPGSFCPLILDDANRLYLQRYWQYEQQLAEEIRQRSRPALNPLNEPWLREALEHVLPLRPGYTEDQRRAALAALQNQFCVITGGPGTGKTRTVAVILVLLWQHAFIHEWERPRIVLAAPTGKAAARLSEALQNALGKDPLAQAFGDSPVPQAVTLHRLLGLSPTTSRPRYHREHPLPADVVIVDEASMIDLSMMAKLFRAVSPSARLILLGDRNQLASVEAGHVLGAMVEASETQHTSLFAELTHNFRFAHGGGIQTLSTFLKDGAVEQAVAVISSGESSEVIGHPLPAPSALASHLRGPVEQAYQRVVKCRDPASALLAAQEYRILCAVRGGPYGVEHFNRLAESILTSIGVHPHGRHYRGRPIMITQNDYQLGLFNGDIGVLWTDTDHGGELRAFFPAPLGETRSLHPARLPEHETVWAMTVHKSQGSEFDRILLVLPERDTPLLTRELLYTGLTRARTAADLWYHEPTLQAAIERKTVRFSGLKDQVLSSEGIQDGAAQATPSSM